MTIRSKILIYFSASTILLIGIAFIFIYTLFAKYQKEEFRQRQKEKIITSLTFLSQIKETESAVIGKLNTLDINNLLDEKVLIFNRDKKLIYSSIDDTPISFSAQMVASLSRQRPWIEKEDGKYDVIGMYIESHSASYYGISKAYDAFGYSKLDFLKYVLLITFFSIVVAITLVSFYLSKRITQPIVNVTRKIKEYDLEEKYVPLKIEQSKSEVVSLVEQFNKLMKRMNDAFEFQKHAIHHISHELKTPITVLVSNFERIEKEQDIERVRALIVMQKEDTKSLSEIINALLEIAKAETDHGLTVEQIRIDELIFDLAEELNIVYPNFVFSIDYHQEGEDASFEAAVNLRLFKAAILNLMQNCVQYSSNGKAKISLISNNKGLQLVFENEGANIRQEEIPYLFQHFFRGANSKGKRGFGLGLVFLHKIMLLHNGSVSYSSPNDHTNRFLIELQ